MEGTTSLKKKNPVSTKHYYCMVKEEKQMDTRKHIPTQNIYPSSAEANILNDDSQGITSNDVYP